MEFEHSATVKALEERVQAFMDEHVYPNERTFETQLAANRWAQPPILEELKATARAAGGSPPSSPPRR